MLGVSKKLKDFPGNLTNSWKSYEIMWNNEILGDYSFDKDVQADNVQFYNFGF